MALLTEEQIKDVMAMFDCYASGRYKKSFEYDFGEWNEKQPSTQFEPDWSKAPTAATSAILRLVWVVEESWSVGGYQIAKYDRPAPVITPHPHAEIMAKYAEVAARRSDPWVEFEHCCDDIDEDYWIQCDAFIGFHSDYFYRHISYRHIGDEK